MSSNSAIRASFIFLFRLSSLIFRILSKVRVVGDCVLNPPNETRSLDLNAIRQQGLQIDLVALLRLEIDSMSGAVLAGETVDLNRLVTAHGLLARMLAAQALVAPAPAPEARFGNNARQRLRELIEKTVLADAEAEHERDILAREEQAAIAAALPVEATKAAPAPVAPPSEPPGADNVVPLDPNNRRPPDHYLAQYQRQNEPWRSYTTTYRDRWSPPFGW